MLSSCGDVGAHTTGTCAGRHQSDCSLPREIAAVRLTGLRPKPRRRGRLPREPRRAAVRARRRAADGRHEGSSRAAQHRVRGRGRARVHLDPDARLQPRALQSLPPRGDARRLLVPRALGSRQAPSGGGSLLSRWRVLARRVRLVRVWTALFDNLTS